MFDIKASYEKFLNNSVEVEKYLAVELSEIEKSEYNDMTMTLKRAQPEQACVIDAFAENYGYLPSSTNMLLISEFYYQTKVYDKSISWGLKALEESPGWDLYSLGKIFGIIANILVSKEEYKEALGWAKIGLTYNPFEPYLVGAMCRAYYHSGNTKVAGTFFEWLRQHGFNSSYWGEYPVFEHDDEQMYQPSIKNMIKLNREDLFKMSVTQYFSSGRSTEENLINRALCLISCELYSLAFYTIYLALNFAKSEEKMIAFQISEALMAELPRSDISKIILNRGIFSNDEKERLSSLNEIAERNDIELLYGFVNDYSPNVSLSACNVLVESGERGPLTDFVELFYLLEKRLGKVSAVDFNLDDLVELSKYPAVKERGVALVDRIISDIKNGKSRIKIQKPIPIKENIVEKIRFSNGRPLPPSLKHLLKFDCSWFFTKFEGIYNPETFEIQITPLDGAAWRLAPNPGLPKGINGLEFNGDCIIIGRDGSEMDVFLSEYSDTRGEYPVLLLRSEGETVTTLLASGFDIWLAIESGTITKPQLEVRKDMQAAQKKLNEFKEQRKLAEQKKAEQSLLKEEKEEKEVKEELEALEQYKEKCDNDTEVDSVNDGGYEEEGKYESNNLDLGERKTGNNGDNTETIDENSNEDYFGKKEEDVNIPKILNVKIYNSNTMQKIFFRAKVLKNNDNREVDGNINAIMKFLEVMANAGLAGSDAFSPAEQYARWIGPKFNKSTESDNWLEWSGELETAGVSKDVFCIFLKLFFAYFKTIEFEAISEYQDSNKPDIDEIEALEIIKNSYKFKYSAWNEIPFEVVENPVKGQLLKIKLKNNVGLDLIRAITNKSIYLLGLYCFGNDIKKIQELQLNIMKNADEIVINIDTSKDTASLIDKNIAKAIFINSLIKAVYDNDFVEIMEWNF